MCDYCKKEKEIITKKIVSDWIFSWIKEVKSKDITYDTYNIFIDRGYLRFTDADDSQCIDHGERIKINFCPFCGEGLI